MPAQKTYFVSFICYSCDGTNHDLRRIVCHDQLLSYTKLVTADKYVTDGAY